MGKIKKLLSIFTAALVAVSLALSSGVTSAISEVQIRDAIRNLVVHYGENGPNRRIADHDGWLNLLSNVLGYADATAEDVTATQNYGTDSWADWIMRPDGFQASSDPAAEANNLSAMITNFGHGDRYWKSNWKVKDDFALLTDWGAIYYTVQNREGREKPYKGYCYDNVKFLHKIREIYNLNPETNARKYDVLCLRALFRAMVEYDKFLGLEHDASLDSFVDGMTKRGVFMREFMALLAQNGAWPETLQTEQVFSLEDRLPRQNAVADYEKIAVILIATFYNAIDKVEHRDYEIIFDDNGYVVRIEPIVSPQSGDPNPIMLKPGKGNKAGGGGGPDPRGRIIKGTGSGIDHFSAAIVALAISASGIAGLGYVASRKRRKNAK